MKLQTILIVPVAAVMTSCSLYSSKPKDYVVIPYAQAAKREAIKQGKNEDNKVIDEWIETTCGSIKDTADQWWGKVDLSSNAIPPTVHGEVTRILGKDIDLQSLTPKKPLGEKGAKLTGTQVSESGKALPDWLTVLLELLKEANSAARSHQRDVLIRQLEGAKWGQPNLPPT
ncbi:hypothetical protein [Prosthecobacter sp.]|uniref:hypothetical protein n=1 Tax=Prosthecobacter sp. TaxID=1965333 RepID=UPI00378412BD